MDCVSFFMKTVTPATVTATATVFSTTTASTATLINVNTIVSTTLETVEVTTVPTILATTVVTDFIVVTVPSTLVPTTVTEPTVVTVQEKRAVSPTGGRHMLEYQDASLAPRQVTIAPSRVPTYASACSGTVRYSSACSCIGVTYSTITVAAPTTTMTTTIAITNTASTTVQTSMLVQDVSLTTVVVTYPTTIVITIETEVISSQIVVTTVAAATVDVTSTVFLCPNPTPTFYLQAVVDGVAGEYAAIAPYDGGFNTQVIQLETSIENAAKFYLDGSGHLISGNSIANIDSSPGETIFFNTAAQLGNPTTEVELQCSVVDLGIARFLTCTAGSDGTFELCPAGTKDGIYPIGGVAITSARATACQQLTLEVIPQCIVTAPPPEES